MYFAYKSFPLYTNIINHCAKCLNSKDPRFTISVILTIIVSIHTLIIHHVTDHLFCIAICGRGEPLRLLLNDAGVKFEYIKLAFSEWPSVKQKLIENGCRIPTLPYLVTKSGRFYGTTAPLLRLISKKLNKYIPKDTEDEYLADAYSDLYLDWMNKWVEVLVSKDPKIANHYETTYRDNQQTNWENILGDKSGPYILGEEVCKLMK